jgi:hypothetical protein
MSTCVPLGLLYAINWSLYKKSVWTNIVSKINSVLHIFLVRCILSVLFESKIYVCFSSLLDYIPFSLGSMYIVQMYIPSLINLSYRYIEYLG